MLSHKRNYTNFLGLPAYSVYPSNTYCEAKIRPNGLYLLFTINFNHICPFMVFPFCRIYVLSRAPYLAACDTMHSEKVLFSILKNSTEFFFLSKDTCYLPSAFYQALIISCLDWCKNLFNECPASVLLPSKPYYYWEGIIVEKIKWVNIWKMLSTVPGTKQKLYHLSYYYCLLVAVFFFFFFGS